MILSSRYLENTIKDIKIDNYKQCLKNDIQATKNYYTKSVVKTEQQKMLEYLLHNDSKFINNLQISDIACGGGTLSYHLSKITKNSNFTLVDYMDESITISKELNKDDLNHFEFILGDIYNLDFIENQFDFTFCWQTLSWLDNPKEALLELIRITKSGGKIYLSSLFNMEHDVDVYSKVFDYTRNSGLNAIPMTYNTYSLFTIDRWLQTKVANYKIHKMETSIDFHYDGRGLGTFTQNCENEKIQISAGMLMNWGILEIEV